MSINNNNKILIVIVIFTVVVIGVSLYLNKVYKQKDDLELDEDCIIAILAPWCGHCKNLKKSGMLEELSKHIRVIEIDDKHKNTKDILSAVKSEGFPTLVLYKQGNLIRYDGERTTESIVRFINSQ